MLLHLINRQIEVLVVVHKEEVDTLDREKSGLQKAVELAVKQYKDFRTLELLILVVYISSCWSFRLL